METKFTPRAGSWWLSPSREILEMPQQIKICNRVDGANPDEAKANANLMVASPDMFEVLASLENDNGSIPAAIWEMRNKALAKARGK